MFCGHHVLDPQDGGTTLLWNDSNYLPIDDMQEDLNLY